MTTGIRGDHLARLQADLKRQSDRIYELERRIKPDPAAAKRENITWYGSALPTTNLYPGRRVYAVALSNDIFGQNKGRRLYVYDPQPREGAYGDGPRGWRLVHPIKFSFPVPTDTIVGAGTRVLSNGIDFGIAPVSCDVTVKVQGCVQLEDVGNTEAICNIERGTDSAVLRRVCLWLPTASFTMARPTMQAEYHKLTAAGERVYYQMSFYTSSTTTNFVGESTYVPDAWEITVEIS